MKNVADVSVVCANYNNGRFLHDFFQGFADSKIWPKELIFVDDGSIDDSISIAETFTPLLPFLKILPLTKNVGFGNALNEGIRCATASYIMRIDPDDIVLPDRIGIQVEMLSLGDFDVVGSNAEIFHSESGRALGKTNFPLRHLEISAKIRAGEHGVLHPTVMARASLFKSNLYIQENVPAEDYDIFARMLKSGARFANTGTVLTRYRVHQMSASNHLPFSTINKTFKIRDALFNTRTSLFNVLVYYVHIKYYRKYLFSQSLIPRFLFLAVSSALYPRKLLRRIDFGRRLF
jgi:glycosyltransferase involved in cell wall biosynthesis